LEYHWGNPPTPQVVVEAKLGDRLTVEQIGAYRDRLPADGGLLVALLPEARRSDGVRVLAEYRQAQEDDPVRLAVWSFDDVARALDVHLPGSADVAQFRGLLRASQALDIFPLLEAELWDDSDARRDDMWRVVDPASFGLFGQKLPAGHESGFTVRRYVNLAPYRAFFAVGVGRESRAVDGQAQPWAWLRVSRDTPYAKVVQQAVAAMRPGRTSTDAHGLWTPLDIPADAPGTVMVSAVRDQIEEFGTAARTAIEEAIRTEVQPAPADLHDVLPAVLGMPPIDRVDLLDTSDRRLADIKLILTQVARSVTVGKIYPEVAKDQDFVWVRYLEIKPLGAFVATAVGRKDRLGSGGPQPWAWLRVHRVTPHAGIGFKVLEQLAPGQVVTDPNGRAIPLDLPDGASGAQLLQAAYRQVSEAMDAVRTAVLQRHA